QCAAYSRDAPGRDYSDALGRVLGRDRRTYDRGGSARGSQRLFCGHGQAHSLVPIEEARYPRRVDASPAAVKRTAASRVHGGSRTIRRSHIMLRRAGATAREMLIRAAATEWNVPAGECRADRSVITHVPTGRALKFGEVAAAAAKFEAPKDVPLKEAKDWI